MRERGGEGGRERSDNDAREWSVTRAAAVSFV